VDVADGHFLQGFQAVQSNVADGRSRLEVNAGMSHAARYLINRLLARYPRRSVALLRVYGHAYPGQIFVGGGDADYLGTSYVAREMIEGTSFSADLLDYDNVKNDFVRLGNLMKPYGSIELHGCNVEAAFTQCQW
jgi:hypothetical protein